MVQIFEDENSHHELTHGFCYPLPIERLGDDGGAGDGDDRAGKQALDSRPSQQLSGYEAQPDHETGLHERSQTRSGAQLEQLAEAELEPERKHQQNDAELGQRLDDPAIRNERDWHVRADDEPGQNVAKHHGLVQSLKQHGRDGGHAQDGRQRQQESMGIHNTRLRCLFESHTP
jgi:hypothetical protein